MDSVQVEKAVKELGDKPTLKNFIEQFGVFAQGPNSITQLKELILGLACAGQLTEQRSADKAVELLTEIKNEKIEFVKNKMIKKTKTLFPIGEVIEPFEIPGNWIWVFLGDLSYMLVDGSHNPPKKVDEGIPMLSGQNVRDGYITLEASRYITEDDYLKERERNPIENGDVFLSIVGSIGRSSVVENSEIKYAIQRSIAQIKSRLDPHYFSYFLRSPIALSYYDENAKGTAQKGIYLNQLSFLPVALPPLEEQKHIVAKVDELMTLCDQLEAQQQQQANTLLKANTAAIHALLSSDNSKEDLTKNWQRLSDNFHTLYGNTLPMPPGKGRQKKYFVGLENVRALRKCILKLAVSGHLTARGDDSAIDDLNKILKTRKKLEIEKKIKKYIIHKDEQGITIPEGWEFTRLGCITDISSGSTPLKGKLQYYEDGKIPWVTSSATSNEFICSSTSVPLTA